MNKKQFIVISGLVAYIAGGLSVVVFNLGAFIGILRFQINLLTPIVVTFGIILIACIAMSYFFRDKKK
jgi:uncharacterized membrane protein